MVSRGAEGLGDDAGGTERESLSYRREGSITAAELAGGWVWGGGALEAGCSELDSHSFRWVGSTMAAELLGG